MSRRDDDFVPSGFEQLEHRLRESRADVSELDLDRVKLQVKARAFTSRPRGTAVRSRFVAGLVSVGLMVGGSGSVLADSNDNGGGGGDHNGNGDNGEGSAAKAQYCDHGSHASQCQQGSQSNQTNRSHHGSEDHGGGGHGGGGDHGGGDHGGGDHGGGDH